MYPFAVDFHTAHIYTVVNKGIIWVDANTQYILLSGYEMIYCISGYEIFIFLYSSFHSYITVIWT